MKFLVVFALLPTTQCGVRKDPISKHTQSGPHSALRQGSKIRDKDKIPNVIDKDDPTSNDKGP